MSRSKNPKCWGSTKKLFLCFEWVKNLCIKRIPVDLLDEFNSKIISAAEFKKLWLAYGPNIVWLKNVMFCKYSPDIRHELFACDRWFLVSPHLWWVHGWGQGVCRPQFSRVLSGRGVACISEAELRGLTYQSAQTALANLIYEWSHMSLELG